MNKKCCLELCVHHNGRFFFCRELVHELHKSEKEVYLISGGFRSIIEPVAKDLGIPLSNIYANKIKFYHDGKLIFRYHYKYIFLLLGTFVHQSILFCFISYVKEKYIAHQVEIWHSRCLLFSCLFHSIHF